MKQRLAEDIAETAFPEWTPGAGVNKGLINWTDDYSQVPDWDTVMAIVRRRERASKRVPNCPECGTEQVQLVHWQTSNLRYKCRHCKHKFERDENGKA